MDKDSAKKVYPYITYEYTNAVTLNEIAKEIRDSDIPVIGITNMLDEDEIEAKVIPVLQNL